MIKNSAEKKQNPYHRAVSAGIFLCLVVSIPLVLILLLFTNKLSFIFADKRCYDVLIIMLPGVIITSVYAVIRGFLWGRKKFLTYSAIELAEETVMLVIGIVLVLNATSSFDGAKRAAYAVLISYVFSFITAIIFYFINGGKLSSPISELKPLISSSAPITLMRATTSLINTLIAIILPARLILAGISSKQALSTFGELSGMSIPLIYIPSTLIGSIALVLVPELSGNYYNRNLVTLKNNIEEAVKCSIFIATLIIPVFLSTGKELGILLYANENAGIYVRNACFIMLPMSITMITTSILNSINLERKTLSYFLIGAVFLLASIYFLPQFINVYALIFGLLISYIITAVLNLLLIKKTCITPPRYTVFIITSIIFMIPSALLGHLLKGILLNFMPMIIAVPICMLVVMAFTYAFYRIFDLFDIKALLK